MPSDAIAAERAAHARGAHDAVLGGRDDRVPCLLLRDHDPCEARGPSSRRKNDCDRGDSCGGQQKSSLHRWLPPLEPASRRRDALAGSTDRLLAFGDGWAATALLLERSHRRPELGACGESLLQATAFEGCPH